MGATCCASGVISVSDNKEPVKMVFRYDGIQSGTKVYTMDNNASTVDTLEEISENEILYAIW